MDKKSKGRQKIKMAKIKNESNLQVTFSKRRSGIFKKANELSTLCGAQVAIIIFSPGNKAYSFGHPNVESVIDRFLSRNPLPNANNFMDQLVEAQRDVTVRDLNMYLSNIEHLLESEKKHGEALNQMWVSGQAPPWWTNPINELNLQQLQMMKAKMEELKQKVTMKTDQLVVDAMNPLPFDANASGVDGSTSMMYHGVNRGFGPGFY